MDTKCEICNYSYSKIERLLRREKKIIVINLTKISQAQTVVLREKHRKKILSRRAFARL